MRRCVCSSTQARPASGRWSRRLSSLRKRRSGTPFPQPGPRRFLPDVRRHTAFAAAFSATGGGGGVTGRKLGIFHDGLPPVEIGIGFHRCPAPPASHPARVSVSGPHAPDGNADCHSPRPSQSAVLPGGRPERRSYRPSTLLTSPWRVDRNFLHRPGQWVAMFLAGRLYGDSSFRRIQPIRRLVRLADGLFTLR